MERNNLTHLSTGQPTYWPSGLCYKSYSSWLRCSPIMSRPIFRSFPGLGNS
jgi:hypothetical protein